MNDENKSAYYYIVQKVKNFTYSNMLVEPTSIKDVKKLVTCLVGNVSVYFYKDDNSYIDLTDKLGKYDTDINFDKLYRVSRVIYRSIKSIENNPAGWETDLKNLFIYDSSDLPKTLKSSGIVFRQKSWYYLVHWDDIINNYESENQRKIIAGREYEKYVAQKYIQNGYEVKYNGIENGVKDEGIDLIAYKDNKIFLIQCKNWKETGYQEINAKDIKAFFGNCFKFVLDNGLIDKKLGFHYIFAHKETINKSALAYLQNNKHIKYKCIPFEIANLKQLSDD